MTLDTSTGTLCIHKMPLLLLLLLLRAVFPSPNAGRERACCTLLLQGVAVGVRRLWSCRCSARCGPTHSRTPHQRQPAGHNNNGISHLKMRRQVDTHGWSPPPISAFSYLSRLSGNTLILKKVANYQWTISQKRINSVTL